MLKASFQDGSCHLDPDIRPGLAMCEGWVPAFGQTGAAQTHLQKQGVGTGDLFLFFGWFRSTRWKKDRLTYDGPDIQAIYGYLQIGEVLKGKDIPLRCPWHPHAGNEYGKNNTLYLSCGELTFDNTPTGLPGCGVLPFRENLVLTKPGESRSRWKRLPWMEHAQISRHNATSIKENFFQSVSIGQEFVIQENTSVCRWAEELIRGSATNQ